MKSQTRERNDIMQKLQDEYKRFVKEMGFDNFNFEEYQSNKMFLLYVHMLLTTEVAEIAEEFRDIFKITEKNIANGLDEKTALNIAKKEVRENLGKEFADCLAYLCKLANYFDYDLETEFYSKLDEIRNTRKLPIK
jgi:NTP pyrophosphatase (non-canonical NTP hydrolase)